MNNQRFDTTRNVSIISAIVNTLLAISKIIIGIIGRSQALVADGLHSVSDVVSDALVVVAAKASQQQPDEQHPYGHQRIETIAVIIIAMILLAIGIGILYPALMELIHQDYGKPPTLLALIIAIVSIIANELLFHYCHYKGKQIESDLLISNAWHNRSDALVSLIVVISIIGSFLGLHWLDAVGAGIIALLLIYVSGKMLWNSGNELIDAAVEPETGELIEHTIANTPGVVSVHNIRTRKHAQHIFIDAHVEVAPTLSVSEGHHIADSAEHALRDINHNIVDVAIHIDPEDDTHEHHHTPRAHRHDLLPHIQSAIKQITPSVSLHDLTLHYLEHQLSVTLTINISTEQLTQAAEISHALTQAINRIDGIDHCHVHFHLENNAS